MSKWNIYAWRRFGKRLWRNSMSFSAGRCVLLGGLIGIVSGFGAIFFNYIIRKSESLFLLKLAGCGQIDMGGHAAILTLPEDWRWWLFPLIPALGGLLSGWIVYRWAPEAAGHGTDAMIKSFHHRQGVVRPAIPIVKVIASAITIGSGGSAGKEGPIAQIGSGFASWFAGLLKLGSVERRTLLLAGAGGGIGATFCAPLGGALFAVEVLYRNEELETEALIPCVISSLVGYSVFTSFTGQTSVFPTDGFHFHHMRELVPYAILGVLCALVGLVYVKCFYGAQTKLFSRMHLPLPMVPCIGGFLLGLTALFTPQVLSTGYGIIEQAFAGNLAISLMLVLVVTKIIATCCTISSGGSGGVFGPSLFIGAMLGGAVGKLLDTTVLNGWIVDPRAFALVGMVGFFSGIAKTPIASLILITEMAQSYGLLVPMMLVSSITFLITGQVTLYAEQTPTRADSPAHFGDYLIDVLAGLKVKQASLEREITTIPARTTLRNMLQMLVSSPQGLFPVVNPDGSVYGFVSLNDIRGVLFEEQMRDLIIAADIADVEHDVVHPDDDLHTVLRKLTEAHQDELPVISPEDRSFLGMVTRRDLLNLYNRRLLEISEGR